MQSSPLPGERAWITHGIHWMEISEWRQCQFVDCEYSTSVEFSLFHISERHGSLLDGDIGVAPNRSQCHSADCGYCTSNIFTFSHFREGLDHSWIAHNATLQIVNILLQLNVADQYFHSFTLLHSF